MTVADEVTNISAEPGELELLYHINFGVPLVSPGAKVVLPVKRLAPRDAVAVGRHADVERLRPRDARLDRGRVTSSTWRPMPPGKTLALLRSADGAQGVSVKFNKRQLPCFTIWKNRQAAIDGYVTGLEPATNYPNPKSFEKQQGRVVALAPGETRRFEVTIEAHADAGAVAAAEQAVAAIQGNTVPEICDKPDPNWAAG